MTKRHTINGRELTDEWADELVAQTYAELSAITPEELAAHTHPGGTLAKRMGRPRVGGDFSSGASTQIRVRVDDDTVAALDARAKEEHRTRSDVVRDALSAFVLENRK